MPFKKNLGKNMQDIALFGRVLSVGLMMAGYTFGGVVFARWLQGKGYPPLIVAATPPLAVLVGLWQGWLFLSHLKDGRRK